MDIKAINTAILQGNFTNDQLTSIVDAVKYSRARLMERNKRSLMLGDQVSFDSNKLGRGVTGTVTKIAIKYVTVNTSQGVWKVPANMLSIA
jgi:small-conductance mechanosensitive channel